MPVEWQYIRDDEAKTDDEAETPYLEPHRPENPTTLLWLDRIDCLFAGFQEDAPSKF